MFAISDRPGEPTGPEDPQNPSERRQTPPSLEEIRDEISREILRIHQESYGNGAGRVHTLIEEDYVIVVLDDLELMQNEKFLIENGKTETVAQVRTQYQHAIRTTFTAAIERSTGRNVVGFASSANMDEPRFVAEIFRLD